MNEETADLLTSGAFAKASLLSPKALRLYEQLGILLPWRVDPANHYRYYHPDQLKEARQVRIMRDMEMPLSIIRQLLNSRDTAVLVNAYVEAFQARLAEVQQLAPYLMYLIQPKESTMQYDIQVIQSPGQQVLSITGNVFVKELDQFIRTSLDKLLALVEEKGLMAAGSPFGIYHGPINPTQNGPIEVCLPIPSPLSPPEDIVYRSLPPTQYAAVTILGEQCEFPAILSAYDSVCDWVIKNGYELEDAPREVWLDAGDEMVMRIEWAFTKREGVPAG